MSVRKAGVPIATTPKLSKPTSPPAAANLVKQPASKKGDGYGPGQSSREKLVGHPTAVPRPAVALTLPEWYPPGFDLGVAAAGARALLEAQGENVDAMLGGGVRNVVFTDADHTFLKTTTPTLVKHKETGDYLRHPDTGRLMMLPGPDLKKQHEELQARFPQIDWAKYGLDYKEFGSIGEILRTPEIPQTIAKLKASDRNPHSRDFVITARSEEAAVTGMHEYLGRRGVDIDGVVAVGCKSHNERIGTADKGLSSAQRKAVSMAGLMKLCDPKTATVRTVKYYEDSDENLVAAMQLLPRLFPAVRFEFHDVLHKGEHRFESKLVAKSAGEGQLVDGAGRALSGSELSGYRSVDAPLVDPLYE